MKKWGIWNGFWLKIMMAALMLLDHMWHFLPPQPLWYHQASRVVAPVFAFLVAEGLYYTRDRISYCCRMLLFGGGMLVISQFMVSFLGGEINNTILISLGLSAASVYCFERRKIPYILAGALLFFLASFFEGAFICPILVNLFFYLRSRPLIMSASYVVGIPLLLWVMGYSFGNVQYLMVFAIIPILLYNGERGPNGPFAKYFFYVFYPAHIWILYLMNRGIISF